MENIPVIISGRGIGDKQLLNQSEIPTHTDVIYMYMKVYKYTIHILSNTLHYDHWSLINLYSLDCVYFDTKPCKTMLRLNGGAFFKNPPSSKLFPKTTKLKTFFFSKTHRAQNFFQNPQSSKLFQKPDELKTFCMFKIFCLCVPFLFMRWCPSGPHSKIWSGLDMRKYSSLVNSSCQRWWQVWNV